MATLNELKDGTYRGGLRREGAKARTLCCELNLFPGLTEHTDPTRSSRPNAALKDALDKRGTLNELKAKVRSEVFSAIDDTKVG